MSKKALRHLVALKDELQFLDKVTQNLKPSAKFTVELSQAEGRAVRKGINWLLENWTETQTVLSKNQMHYLENVGTRIFLKLNPRPKR